jgi:hypothetical protein
VDLLALILFLAAAVVFAVGRAWPMVLVALGLAATVATAAGVHVG